MTFLEREKWKHAPLCKESNESQCQATVSVAAHQVLPQTVSHTMAWPGFTHDDVGGSHQLGIFDDCFKIIVFFNDNDFRA